jgi:hypothetical protein
MREEKREAGPQSTHNPPSTKDRVEQQALIRLDTEINPKAGEDVDSFRLKNQLISDDGRRLDDSRWGHKIVDRKTRGCSASDHTASTLPFPPVSQLPTPRNSPLSTPPDDAFTYPEGGLRAWLVVFGSWCGLFASLGITNTLASFQAYLSTDQLSSYAPGQIGWIFSLYTFLLFACGIYIGPLFDVYGPRWLILPGSGCVVLNIFLLGVCTEYWHFIIVFGILGGVGTSLLFTPCIAAVSHFFNRRRGNATGIAATGGAIGGIVFPLLLQSLIPRIGFIWSTRVMGFIILFFCIIANSLIASRLPPGLAGRSPHPDFKILMKPAFAITVLGVFLIEWALFIPLTYITSYALEQGYSQSFAYQILPM